jgi:hypothetical protein
VVPRLRTKRLGRSARQPHDTRSNNASSVIPTNLLPPRWNAHRQINVIVVTPKSPEESLSSVQTFFETLKTRTADPVHNRLIMAASRANPGASMENELNKIIVELLDET